MIPVIEQPELVGLVERLRDAESPEAMVPEIVEHLKAHGDGRHAAIAALPALPTFVARAIWNTERERNVTREQCDQRAARLVAKNNPDSLYLSLGRGTLVDEIERVLFFQPRN